MASNSCNFNLINKLFNDIKGIRTIIDNLPQVPRDSIAEALQARKLIPPTSLSTKLYESLSSTYGLTTPVWNDLVLAMQELKKLQAAFPSQALLDELQLSLPTSLELNQHIAGIKAVSNSSLNFIDNLKVDFDSFFPYEDIYEKEYRKQYSKIDFDRNDFVCNEDDPFTLKVRDNQSLDEYPLSNQKDVIGLPSLFESISEKKAIDFIEFLSKYPYLGLDHEVGNIILDDLRTKSNNLIHINSQSNFYRARIWEENQEIHYVTSQLWQAPYGKSEMARFNPIGINYLYMADSVETTKAELRKEKKITVMQATLKNDISILDLSENKCVIFELCNKRKSSTLTNPNEYLLPNFIAQCCTYLTDMEDKKIEGLKYKSTLSTDGYCYVFFNKYPDSFSNEKIIHD